ncbi:MAG: hypothetical protein CME88_12545 [Hirschia sp.]|nr:hypothetical protein [Hirschia sp.]MBF19196.1 hypothetical protein [Hirschia sp.]
MTDNNSNGLETLGAQFLERHMKREQTAFIVFIGVFMLLLIGIAVLFIYNGMVMRDDLKALREESHRSRFEAIASIAEAKAQSQTSRENLQNEVVAQRHQTESARADIVYALRANREEAEPLVEDAARFAKAHILGWPLNDSTANLVTAARGADGLSKDLAAVFDYALADWRGGALDADSAIGALATSGPLEGYYHAARAKALYAGAANDDYAWSPARPFGCEAVVNAVNDTLMTLRRENAIPKGMNDKGLLLNLYYYKGQCQRKNGMAEAGYVTFTEALQLVESNRVSDANTNKFQAYHGAGSTLMVLVGDPNVSIILPPDPLLSAERQLRMAADLRTAWGQTEVGRVGSTENIAFIYLREAGQAKWDKILRHTADVDSVTSMTWNLIARLIAAKEKAKITPPGTETCESLREIIFETGAKLSRRTAASFDREELQLLLTERYAPYIFEAESWVDLAEMERIGDDVRLTAAGDSRLQSASITRANEMITQALEAPCTGGVDASGE